MTLNKLEAFIDSDLFAKVREHAEICGSHLDDAVAGLLADALAPTTVPVTVPVAVIGQEKFSLPVPVTADVAEFAASSGISFDLALASLVSTGIGYIRAQAATTP